MVNDFLKFIDGSDLTDAQKKYWIIFANSVGRDEVENIFEIVKNNPEDLIFLTKNIEDKITAIDKTDSYEWDRIVREEKEYLSKI